MVTTHSQKLIPFLGELEGDVLRAYRDSGGVITIGRGATNLSTAASRWFQRKWGRPLQMGDRITPAESDELLDLLLNEEYIPYVVNAMGPNLPQHQLDQSGSTTYNCGPGTLRDRWAEALRQGNVAQAAALLATTRIRDRSGTELEGLKRRRREEGELMLHGDYVIAGGSTSLSVSPSQIADYQSKLATLKYYTGEISGIADEATIDAVKRFQRASGLEDDGKVGPATRAALQRAVDARAQLQQSGAGGAAGAGGDAVVDTVTPDPVVVPPTDPVTPTPPPTETVPVEVLTAADALHYAMIGISVAAVVFTGWMIWRYRGVIMQVLYKVLPFLKPKLSRRIEVRP